MHPDLAFLVSLVLRMAVAAGFVVTASIITERAGPVVGALVATLPISAGPSYVFLAMDHDASFIATSALTSLPVNAATVFLCLAYSAVAQRGSYPMSFAAALGTWAVLATLIRQFEWSLIGGVLLNAVAFVICLPLVQRYRHARMPLITRRWYDIPLRAALVATLVAVVVATSGKVSPRVSGTLALFPAVFTSLILILHPRIGGPPTAALMSNSLWGLVGFAAAIAVLQAAVVPLGLAAAFLLALVTCVGWNIGLWWNGRRRALRQVAQGGTA